MNSIIIKPKTLPIHLGKAARFLNIACFYNISCNYAYTKSSPRSVWERGLVCYLFFFLKLQNISGFAIKHVADRCKGGKANSRYFVVFDFRIYSISRIEIALVCGIVFHSTFANNAIINEIFPIISKIGNVNEYHNFLYHFIFAILLFSIINM